MLKRTEKNLKRGVFLVAFVMLSFSAFATAAADNAATRWMEEALQSVIESNIGTFPAGRVYAMTTVAMYDGVNGIYYNSNNGPRRAHAMVSAQGAPNNADPEVAAAAAAHAVLSDFFPARQARFDALLAWEVEHSNYNTNRISRGWEWGEYVGHQILAARSEDGVQEAFPLVPATGAAGEFHQPWDARFANMMPFGISELEAFLSDGPPDMASPEYAVGVFRSYAQGAPDNNPENDSLASFWRFGGGTIQETGSWFQAALVLARQQGTVDSLNDTARLLALMGMAIGDSVALTAKEKAIHFSWRPFAAIQRHGENYNPLLAAIDGAGWVSRFGQTGGSPDWSSGQSTFAGAGSTVLAQWFCKNDIEFTFNTMTGESDRTYASFMDAAEEAVKSRILQGNHFDFTNGVSKKGGQKLALTIVRERLQREGEKPEIVQYCPQF